MSESSQSLRPDSLLRPLDSALPQKSLARLEQHPKLWTHLSPERICVVHLHIEGSLWCPDKSQLTSPDITGGRVVATAQSVQGLHELCSVLRTHVNPCETHRVRCCVLRHASPVETEANPWSSQSSLLGEFSTNERSCLRKQGGWWFLRKDTSEGTCMCTHLHTDRVCCH